MTDNYQEDKKNARERIEALSCKPINAKPDIFK
jgi:hypothetical protein